MPIVWISEAPILNIAGETVRITLVSGKREFQFAISRRDCRVGAVATANLLDRADIADAATVVAFPRQ